LAGALRNRPERFIRLFGWERLIWLKNDRYLLLKITITWSASPMRFMKPEIRSSPERSTLLSRRIFQPCCPSVLQSLSTISVRFRASSEESSPQANETKISGVLLGGSSGQAAICSWLRPSALSPRSASPCVEERVDGFERPILVENDAIAEES
jgi:hypothetical protein